MVNNQNGSSVPGMIYPTQKSFAPGAGNPRDSAMAEQNNLNAKHANMVAAVGGKRRYKGGAGNIVVPQMQMQYKPQGGPGTDPNSQIAAGFKISTQEYANATFDKHATIHGGLKKRNKSKKGDKSKKGGNPNWFWGCSSGGKKSNQRNKKTRKTKRRKH